jgi:hypothetical protein
MTELRLAAIPQMHDILDIEGARCSPCLHSLAVHGLVICETPRRACTQNFPKRWQIIIFRDFQLLCIEGAISRFREATELAGSVFPRAAVELHWPLETLCLILEI